MTLRVTLHIPSGNNHKICSTTPRRHCEPQRGNPVNSPKIASVATSQ